MEAGLIEKLRSDLNQIGGTNPLVSFELSTFGQVDLARSHPGGLAQLVTSRSTTLSNLVRDGVAQARAHSALRRIKNKAEYISQNYAVQSVFIAAGLIEDRTTGRKLPILLWPTTLISRGEDFELRTEALPRINPAVVELIQTARRDFNPKDLLAVAVGQGDLVPISVLSLVSQLLSGKDVEIEKLLVLGNFVPDLISTQQLDIDFDSGLWRQLGEATTSPSKQGSYILVQNADHSQREIIGAAVAGESFAVNTLPGCGYLQTVVNLLANFSLQKKRVLLIAPRQQTLDEVAERLASIGLAGLAIREGQVWADVVAAISRNEKAQPVDFAVANQQADAAQSEISKYFEVIEQEDPELGVRLVDCLRELASLAVMADAPTNPSRIRSDLLPGLIDRTNELVARAHHAQVFRYGPQDSPWFGARFSSDAEVSRALEAVKSLAGEEFRTLSYQINRYLTDQKLKPCSTVEQWATQLRLLIGIRETLDKFLPAIYDRPLTELVEATAPRGERGELSGAQRRRFRKLAKSYQRPGTSVPNLHIALQQAESQRALWLDLNQTQAPPQVPLGLNDAQSKYDQIYSVLDLLQRHLDPNPDNPLLTRLSFEDLERILNDLATKTEILDHLLERAELVAELAQSGLSDFTVELCKINPSAERAQNELKLSWWQSALEAIVQRNPKILEYSADDIGALERTYESAQVKLLEAGLGHLKNYLAETWKKAIAKYPAQADKLRNQLRQREVSLRSAYLEASPIWQELAPAVLVSPYRLSELSGKEVFDTLIVLDAASIGVAEAAASFTKAEQVIALGDPVIASPENFDTVARANQALAVSDRQSCFDLVSKLFGSLSIVHNYRGEGQVLGRYLNENFYSNRLVLEPAAGQLFGSHNYEQIEIKDGSIASSTIEGATESLDAEVAKVVDLVLNHARWTPGDSLSVVTASAVHAERIQAGVERSLGNQPQLAEFFDSHGREKFEVRTMSQYTHRIADKVIFSLGFGRTPEGRISGTLGDFNSRNAAKWMVNTIVSARKHLTVVSCYNFEDFAAGKLPENQQWLKDLIAPSFLSDVRGGEPDPLLSDLSLRLQKLGFRVELNFGNRIGLAISIGKKAAVIDPDWALQGETWDEKLSIRPGLLKAMGWQYIRVHALEIFAQPQDVANRIAKMMGVDLERKAQPLFEEKAYEDTSRAWGDPDDSNDDRLRDERPPHWG